MEEAIILERKDEFFNYTELKKLDIFNKNIYIYQGQYRVEKYFLSIFLQYFKVPESGIQTCHVMRNHISHVK